MKGADHVYTKYVMANLPVFRLLLLRISSTFSFTPNFWSLSLTNHPTISKSDFSLSSDSICCTFSVLGKRNCLYGLVMKSMSERYTGATSTGDK